MIRHSHDTHSYAPSNYDDDMCLKPTVLLWLALLYLSRAVILPIVIGIGHVANVNAEVMSLLRGYWSVDDLLPTLLALPVLFALFRRVASASKPVRWIWAHGRTFLALSAALDIALRFIPSLLHRELDDEWPMLLLASGIDAYVLIYVLASRRVRDTFLDFPHPLTTK